MNGRYIEIIRKVKEPDSRFSATVKIERLFPSLEAHLPRWTSNHWAIHPWKTRTMTA